MLTLEEKRHVGNEADGTLPKVLVVDDQRENLILVEAVLAKLDVEVTLAANGCEALAALAEDEYACMLLDVTMPDMDGFEVARRMVESGKILQVPVILITGIDRDERALMTGYDAGVADFIFKPFNPRVVRSKVSVFVNLYKERKAQEFANQRLVALQQDLIAGRAAAEASAREIAVQKQELEHRNEELMHRNRELDSFAHVVSHDLRQPLQSVLDYLELIAIEAGDNIDGNIGRWIKACNRLGQNMHTLISDLLEYATLGTQSMVPKRTDCNRSLANALDTLLAEVKQSDACISYDPLPTVQGSEKLLARVFQNLISNALKYRRDVVPHIQVRCEQDTVRRTWLFKVIDNSRGIAPADCQRVFEMFARCSESAAIPGTGIGLALCKRIIEAHGGRIWVKSKVNCGSEFCFVLPEIQPEKPPTEDAVVCHNQES